MGLLKGDYEDKNSVYVKYSGKAGKFIQEVPIGTEGSVTRNKKDSEEQIAELKFPGISGRINGCKPFQDEKFGTLGVRIALVEPGQDDVVATFTVRGESGVNLATVKMLQAIDKADLREMLKFGISHQPAGAKYKDKDGKECVREFGQSTIFVAPVAAKKGEFIHFDLAAIPKPAPMVDGKGNEIKKGGKVLLDDQPLEDYAGQLIASIGTKLEAIRLENKASHETSEQFGPSADDVAAATAAFGS